MLLFNREPVVIKMIEKPITAAKKPISVSEVSSTTSDSSGGDEDVCLSPPTKTVRFSAVPRFIENADDDLGEKQQRWYTTQEIRTMLLETEAEQRDISVTLTGRQWVRCSYAQVLTTIYSSLKNDADVCALPRAEYDRLLKFLSAEKEHYVLTGLERKVADNIHGALFRDVESTRQAVLIVQHEMMGHPEHIRKASLRFSRDAQRLARTIGHAHHETMRLRQERRGLFGAAR